MFASLPLRSLLVVCLLTVTSACGIGADPALDTSRGLTSGTRVGGSCSSGGECQAWSCGCADGTSWDTARYCYNGACQDAATTCSNACRDHGGRVSATSPNSTTSSGTGGSSGSGSSLTCSAASTCPAYACSCADGTWWNSAKYCLNGACQGQSATCANACKSNGGVAGSSTTPTTQSVAACSITKYSSDYSVTAVLYGTGSSQASATSAALSQCADANWASWFCQAASASCHTETAVTYSCTWSKYSSEKATTIHFYGSGLGETAARAAAIDSCLASGAWKGWFCSSGSFSCSKG